MKLQEIVETTRLPPSNAASIPPPEACVAALLNPIAESTELPDIAPLSIPSLPVSPTNGSHVDITRPEGPWCLPATLGPFLSRSLGRRWDAYRAQLRGCQENFSEKAVHELRVATRRLIAQLIMLECMTPGLMAEKARRILKRRLKSLGELRDTHVQRLFVERHMRRFPELILLREFLSRRERRLEKLTAAKVAGFKTRKLEKCITELHEHLTQKSVNARRAERVAATVARATNRAFNDVVQRRRRIDPTNAATVHRTRVAFKKFRYMVESLSPEFTGLGKRELRNLARYQRRMGILQDLEVIQHCVAGYVQQHNPMRPLLKPFVRYLQVSRKRSLRTFMNTADDLFRFWPPAGTGQETKPLSARVAA